MEPEPFHDPERSAIETRPLPTVVDGPSTEPSLPNGTDQAPPTPTRSRRGVLGAIGAALAAVLKYGAVLFKVGKLGPTLISMVVSLALFATLYGPAFGLGILVLIAVHEFGHMLFARYERVPVTAPIFLGIFGAIINIKAPPRDARQEAVIAIGGPIVGSLGALLVYLWAQSLPMGHTRLLLTAIAYFGFFLNLFNLVPVVPLDGGRVASAISVWANVVGLVVMAGLLVISTSIGLSSPFLVILLILGAYTTYRRFQAARRNPAYLAAVPPRVRVGIAAAYLSMVALTALGMAAAHRDLVQAHVVHVATASSWTEAVSQGSADLAAAVGDAEAACRIDPVGSDCADALHRARSAVDSFVSDLDATDVPPGAEAADQTIRAALAAERDALDTALAGNENRDPRLVRSALAGAEGPLQTIASLRDSLSG